jgi:hypothetical protein
MNEMEDFPQPFVEVYHKKQWLGWTSYIKLQDDTLSQEQYAWLLSKLLWPVRRATFTTKHIGMTGLTEGSFTMAMRRK